MPYQRILDELLRSVGGHAALLLDGEGEVAIQAGTRDEGGPIRYMRCRYAAGVVILRPLKDGYYLILSMPIDGRVAEGVHRSEVTQEKLNREL